MPNSFATQGRLLVENIRDFYAAYRRWPTYGELARTSGWVSTCFWRRLTEPAAQRALKKGERIERGTNGEGRVVFKIVRSRA